MVYSCSCIIRTRACAYIFLLCFALLEEQLFLYLFIELHISDFVFEIYVQSVFSLHSYPCSKMVLKVKTFFGKKNFCPLSKEYVYSDTSNEQILKNQKSASQLTQVRKCSGEVSLLSVDLWLQEERDRGQAPGLLVLAHPSKRVGCRH